MKLVGLLQDPQQFEHVHDSAGSKPRLKWRRTESIAAMSHKQRVLIETQLQPMLLAPGKYSLLI